ncbi:MAG TPA: hypothetical protein VFU12_20650 [Glycomyces sp.]|nr:hypothetical protein [Glycomyces sp.]
MGVSKRRTSKATKRITRPTINQLLKGRKLTYKPKGHVDRPRFKKVTTDGFTDVPKPYKKNGKWVLHVKRHDGWNKKDYRAKVDSMKQAGKAGKLKYVKNTKAKRTGAQGQKRDLEERKAVAEATRIEDRGKPDSAQKWLDERLRTLDAQEADHDIELQIDGKDELANLKMIDAATNHGMGGQLRNQILKAIDGGMKPGDLIEIKEVPGLLSNK